jgi:hypothetical protein
MEVSASRGGLRLARRLHALVLLLVSLVLGHQAVFTTQHGLGADLARAMRDGGHDGYWPVFAVTVLAAGSATLGWALLRLQGLASQRPRARGMTPRASRSGVSTATYLRGVVGIWRWLLPLTLLSFVLIENVEHFLQDGHPVGLGALLGSGHPTALPVLTAVSLALAAVGASVRWRERVLLMRAPRGNGEIVLARTPAIVIPPAWAVVAALCRHHWTGLRSVCRRAPPRLAPIAIPRGR